MDRRIGEDWYGTGSRSCRRSERAYRDHGERAWAATDVIAVVTILRENGCDLLGMEIWLPTHPGPTIPMPYFHHWGRATASPRPPTSRPSRGTGPTAPTTAWCPISTSRPEAPAPQIAMWRPISTTWSSGSFRKSA